MGHKKLEAPCTSRRMLSITEARIYTGLGRNLCMKFCKEIGAEVRIGGRLLYDRQVIDAAFNRMHEEMQVDGQDGCDQTERNLSWQ